MKLDRLEDNPPYKVAEGQNLSAWTAKNMQCKLKYSARRLVESLLDSKQVITITECLSVFRKLFEIFFWESILISRTVIKSYFFVKTGVKIFQLKIWVMKNSLILGWLIVWIEWNNRLDPSFQRLMPFSSNWWKNSFLQNNSYL